MLGAATILAGVTEGSAGGFGYLKAILGAIAAVYEVRLRSPAQKFF